MYCQPMKLANLFECNMNYCKGSYDIKLSEIRPVSYDTLGNNMTGEYTTKALGNPV